MMKRDGTESPQSLERRRKKLIRGYLQLGLRLLVIAAVLLILLTQVFLICRMKGLDMYPAVRDGDLLVAFRLQKDYRKNDVVVYRHGEERRVGRIAAAGGDWIEIDETGTLRVNGTVQSDGIFYPTEKREGAEYPEQIPEDGVYVLGDYRTGCRDSRDYGPVPSAELEGKVISLFRRRGL